MENTLFAILSFALLYGGRIAAEENFEMPPVLSIDKVTIAVEHPEAMAKFYTDVFGARLEEVPMGNQRMFRGSLGNLELLLCPKSIAGIKARENNIQLRFVVQDLAKAMEAAVRAGGKKMGEVQKQGQEQLGAVRDPDGNSIELIQKR